MNNVKTCRPFVSPRVLLPHLSRRGGSVSATLAQSPVLAPPEHKEEPLPPDTPSPSSTDDVNKEKLDSPVPIAPAFFLLLSSFTARNSNAHRLNRLRVASQGSLTASGEEASNSGCGKNFIHNKISTCFVAVFAAGCAGPDFNVWRGAELGVAQGPMVKGLSIARWCDHAIE